jgi:two-component sensor histidine kinase
MSADREFDSKYAEEVAAAVYNAVKHASSAQDSGGVQIKITEAADALIFVLAGLLASSTEDAESRTGRETLAHNVAETLLTYMDDAREQIDADELEGDDENDPALN